MESMRATDFTNKILQGDSREVLKRLPAETFHTCVTSPPYYGLRNYGVNGQIGIEKEPQLYIKQLVEVFREVRRVLKDDGTLWVNIGDSFAATGGAHNGRSDNQRGVGARKAHDAGAGDLGVRRPPNGLKPKDLIGIPWMLAFALRSDGWYLRSDIIWNKPNAMPESVRDRPTKAHEYIFLLSKSERYYYDYEAVKEDVSKRSNDRKPAEKRNRRSVWSVNTKPFKGAHFAVFPPELIKPCILAGTPEGGMVLDPFIGSGTTGVAAIDLGRQFTGIDLNPQYITDIAEPRIKDLSRFPGGIEV